MTTVPETYATASPEAWEADTPFAETYAAEGSGSGSPATVGESEGFTAWENESPFAESAAGFTEQNPAEARFAEAYDELRDEAFDEAVADLVAETEQAVEQRFEAEAPASWGTERERFAELHLAPVALEAEQYLSAVGEALSGADVETMGPEQLERLLEAAESHPVDLSPASENFFGAIRNKLRQALRVAKNVAGKVGSLAKGAFNFALRKLKALVRPLLKRVISFAIGRLPAPLRGPARMLAQRIGLEAEEEAQVSDEGRTVSPAVLTDAEALAESFDAALAESLATPPPEGAEFEQFAETQEDERPLEGLELQTLAEARAELVDRLGSAREGEDLTPAIENFIPALLPALRVGIRLVGRDRVVRFLAGYLAKLIGKWVGPQLSGPLSSAIVDVGLRMLTLEAETEAEQPAEAAPAVLAATVEDTVRRLAEAEDYVFDNEDLMQLAVAEAFERSVATNFPARYVRTALQQAPSLGGSFVPRGVRSQRPYRKYTRVPTIEVTEQTAEAVRSFGGTTLAAALRAHGVRLPARVRMHIYEAVAGTTLPRIARNDRALARLGAGPAVWARLHPLTPQAAGLLVREPRLGTAVPPIYLRSRQRIAVGQRFYFLEPLQVGQAARGGQSGRPSQARIRIDLRTATVTTAVYLSEPDAQQIAAAVQQGRGAPVFLQTVGRAIRGITFAPGDRSVSVRGELEEGEEFAAALLGRLAPRVLSVLQRRLRAWAMTMFAEWVRARITEFTRAAADPADGLTLRLTLRAVPGLELVKDALAGRLTPEALRRVLSGDAFRGTPSGTITVVPGRRWK
ncbi:hypothetical protein [Granulicoccus phenolivorans]|uniref:hypothetical protein n=1 Tax=Granulicoccus phenolivorans TaxID=266854 RepID=UPI000421BF8A|nr:hypothetical protein [Granulicoccus phenolivorans]